MNWKFIPDLQTSVVHICAWILIYTSHLSINRSIDRLTDQSIGFDNSFQYNNIIISWSNQFQFQIFSMNNKIIIFFLVVCWSFRFVSEFRKPMMSGSTFCCCCCCFHSSWFVNLYHNNNDNLFFLKREKKVTKKNQDEMFDQKRRKWCWWWRRLLIKTSLFKLLNWIFLFTFHHHHTSKHVYLFFFWSDEPSIHFIIIIIINSMNEIKNFFFFDKPNLIVHHDFFLFEFSPYFNEINLNFFLFSNKNEWKNLLNFSTTTTTIITWWIFFLFLLVWIIFVTLFKFEPKNDHVSSGIEFNPLIPD